MIILALDTTSDLASVALRQNGITVAEESILTTDGHSYLLYQMIQSVLDKAKVSLEQIDCFASAVGPGSFTGVRICLTAAKGLAHATGKLAVGVSNLRALATFGTSPIRNPIIDARRGQIYTARYDAALNLISEEVVILATEWKPDPTAERIDSQPPLAAAIAWCAEMDGFTNWKDPALLDARYVRRSDADSAWVDLK